MDNIIQILFKQNCIEIKAEDLTYSNDGETEQFDYPQSNSKSAFIAVKNRCKNIYKALKEIREYVGNGCR